MSYTSDTFTIYDEQFQAGLLDSLDQNLNVFNESSAGAVQLQSDTLHGDYIRQALLDDLDDDAIAHRASNSIAAVTAKDVTQSELVSVNVLQRVGPFKKTLQAWYDTERDPGTLSVLIGQRVGRVKLKNMIQKALMSVRASIQAQSSLVYDATGLTIKTLTTANLVNGMALMGDASGEIVAWVMHSKNYFDLVGEQVGAKMDTVAGAQMYGGTAATFGRNVIVTDSAALHDDITGTDTYAVLGLVRGAVTIKDFAQGSMVAEVPTGTDNLCGVIQGEYMVNVGCKGCAWNVSAGGPNPVDTALATTTNWTKVAASVKDLGGFMIKVQ